ncbi:uncharacterized protein LOC122964444 [Acropora millepora]|uniref:uncharacterized protein LOC122964444 n=1 Tax=Acropora millepora TaxID=45264 RepID=UPI001CF27A56|nr:uncharacterized protein LOC122964444 [Acropora millepora]
MDKERSAEDYFRWLADELKEKKEKTSRTIICCQTIKQCCIIYSVLRGMVGRELYSNSANDPRHVLLEMLHSCTPDKNKDTILDAFQKKESPIRVLVATIAFGMELTAKVFIVPSTLVHPKTLRRIFRRLEGQEEMENRVWHTSFIRGCFSTMLTKT